MEILVAIKRVPQVGGKVVLNEDATAIETKFLGFTMSPHEECALEEAVRIGERLRGSRTTVVTIGPSAAEEQLRSALSIGIDEGVLLVTPPEERPGQELGPMAVARLLAEHVQSKAASGSPYDLILLGNEAADTGDFQVPERLAHRLGAPCVTAVKRLEVDSGTARAYRERGAAAEVFEVPLPAVVAVKEGINLPRYPSLPGRMRAKSKPVERIEVAWEEDPIRPVGLRLPAEEGRKAEVLGHGAEAAPRIVEILRDLKVLA